MESTFKRSLEGQRVWDEKYRELSMVEGGEVKWRMEGGESRRREGWRV